MVFEEVFEPNFLKMGAYAAIEFGWGIEDSEIKDVEPLSIEEMRRFLTPDPTDPNNSGGVALRERNLKTDRNGRLAGWAETYRASYPL